jgi:hypothetical protein
MQTHSYTLLLARHGELLKWTDYLPPKEDRSYRIVVSNSGGSGVGSSADEEISVPNSGREAGHYLRYIVSHYEDLSDVTVFLQANPWPHVPHDVLPLLEILYGKPSFPHPFCYVGGKYSGPGHPVTPWSATDHVLSLGWQRRTYPEGVPFQIGAQFYVKRDVVHRRPVSHYERILSAADEPEMSLAHALEGHWGNVFDHR